MTPVLAPASDPRSRELRQPVADPVHSVHSHRACGFALDEFFRWYDGESRGPFSKALVQHYRVYLEARQLSASTINLRWRQLRKLAIAAAHKGLLAPELAAGIAHVRGAKRLIRRHARRGHCPAECAGSASA